MKPIIPIIAIALIAITGCTSTTYQDGAKKFSRTSFLNKQTVKEVTYSDKGFSMKGYATDPNVEAANAIAVAVAEAVATAMAKQAPAK